MAYLVILDVNVIVEPAAVPLVAPLEVPQPTDVYPELAVIVGNVTEQPDVDPLYTEQDLEVAPIEDTFEPLLQVKVNVFFQVA